MLLLVSPSSLRADRIHLFDDEVPTIGTDFAIVSFTTASEGPKGFEPRFPATSRVSYCLVGTAGRCGPRRTIVEKKSSPYHLVRLPGLESDSTYRYHIEVTGNSRGKKAPSISSKVELPGAAVANGSFRTLKQPSGRLLFRFASIADIQLTAPDDHYFHDRIIVGKGKAAATGQPGIAFAAAGPYLRLTGRDSVGQMYRDSAGLARAAVAQINTMPGVRFSVIRGDLVQGGRLSEFALVARILGKLRAPYYPIPGNHDAWITADAQGRAGWDRYFPSKSYRIIDMPGAAIITLDTAYPKVREGYEHEGYMSREQFDWLEKTLARHDGPVLIFAHHPLERTTLWDGRPSLPVLSSLFRRSGNVSAFLAGHGHRNKFKGSLWPGGTLSAEGTTLVMYPSGFDVYEIYEGGFVQTFHKVASSNALSISEESRRIQRLGPYESQLKRAGNNQDRNFSALFSSTTGASSGSELIGTH